MVQWVVGSIHADGIHQVISCSSQYSQLVVLPLMVQWVVGSIHVDGPIDLFLVPANTHDWC